ncbi:MAG: hypothetical protein ACJ8AJ_08235 [Gemmatimonadaceae bacterium]
MSSIRTRPPQRRHMAGGERDVFLIAAVFLLADGTAAANYGYGFALTSAD